FLGICNVKGNNIGQQMQLKQADRNNNWAWFQARNVRLAVYETTADELSIPRPDESATERQAREEKAAEYRKRAKSQEEKSEQQKADAEQAQKEYEELSAKDDQFDLTEAALTIGLAMMGVTALLKRWWLFGLALVPAAFGVAMGVAGFAGVDTTFPPVKWMIGVLS
ncbi:MAG TPA: DUF4337 domain-containing protein, partial [Gemmataceae bacterium]|nr:DUF4337 domain-containing protein [Gemmataceae bacterium]